MDPSNSEDPSLEFSTNGETPTESAHPSQVQLEGEDTVWLSLTVSDCFVKRRPRTRAGACGTVSHLTTTEAGNPLKSTVRQSSNDERVHGK